MKRKFDSLTYSILGSDVNTDFVKEAFGDSGGAGSVYVPSGTSQNATQRSGNPPYSLSTSTGIRTPQDMGQSDRETDAPKIAPFPLEGGSGEDQLDQAYSGLANLHVLLKRTQESPNASPAQKNKSQQLAQTIKSVLGNIKKIGSEISKIKL